MLPYRRWANAREFYYCIIVASHANTHNSYTIWLSSYLFFCLSFLLQGYLSLPLTHTHYNSLLDSSILITVLSSESIMSACVVKFRAHPAASFSLLSSAIPHIRLLVQKLRQSLFPFTLFSFSFSFLLLSHLIATAVNSRRSQCNAQNHVGRRSSTWSHTRSFLGPALPSLNRDSLTFFYLLVPEHRVPKGQAHAHIRRVAPTIMIDNSLKLYATPINFLKLDAI